MRRAAVLGLLLATAAPARADDPPASWWHGEDATGTWGGARTKLDDHGLHIDLDYTIEGFTRLAGDGVDPRSDYRGNIDLVLTLDTEKLSLWPGGTIFLYGQNGHGGGISGGIGADMLVSNLEAPEFTQLSEWWLEQALFGARLRLRLGKQDANRDFAAPRFPGNFIHSSFGAMPTIPMPSYPTAGLGAAIFVEPRPWLSLRSAAYEGSPELESFGVDTAFDGGGAFFVAAAMAQHGLGAARPQAVTHSLGGWYHTADVASGERTYDGSYGAFAVVDLLVKVAPDRPEDHRSVGAFLRAGLSPPERNSTSFYVGGAVTYHPIRANDTVGIGGGYARITELAGAAAHGEEFVELFYKARLAPWFTMQPDLQVIAGPDRTAFAGGLRVKLKL